MNDENFNDWRYGVEQNLRAYGLMGFIEGREKRPDEFFLDESHRVGRQNLLYFGERKHAAFRIIYKNAQPILWELEKKGWSLDKDPHEFDRHDPKVDPKALWDAIERWNTDVSYDLKCKYLKELSTIHRDEFSSLDEYLQRAWWLHQRLEDVNLTIPEDVQMGFVIDGVARYNLAWAMITRHDVVAGKLTFRKFINDIRLWEAEFERSYKELHTDDNRGQFTQNRPQNNNQNGRNKRRRRDNGRNRNNQGHR